MFSAHSARASDESPDPIAELVREAHSRLEGLATVECAAEGEAYVLTVSRRGVEASARLKAPFWREYLASGRKDNCDCVDHFFDHLERRIAD